MKKIFTIIFFSLIVLLPLKVSALSVDKTNLSLQKGTNETIGIYAEVTNKITEINFTLVYTSYDVPAYFNLEPGLTDQTPNSISHKIVFPTPISGKIKLGNVRVSIVNNPKITTGSVNIHSATAIAEDGSVIKLNPKTINVTIVKEENTPPDNESQEETNVKEEKNLLKEIQSEIIKMEIKEDVYEYTVNIKNDIKELDLKPIAKSDKYKIDITSQKVEELKDGKIIITVKNDNIEEEYAIKINVIKDVEEVKIDTEKFESTYQYKSKWVVLIIVLSIVLFFGLILNKKK